jgi:hypothetical protein
MKYLKYILVGFVFKVCDIVGGEEAEVVFVCRLENKQITMMKKLIAISETARKVSAIKPMGFKNRVEQKRDALSNALLVMPA